MLSVLIRNYLMSPKDNTLNILITLCSDFLALKQQQQKTDMLTSSSDLIPYYLFLVIFCISWICKNNKIKTYTIWCS